MFLFIALLRICAPALAADLPTAASADAQRFISMESQAAIVSHFSENRCDLVKTAVPTPYLHLLRANIQAIIAYCEPPGVDSRKLFEEALAKDSTGDLIMTLQAKYIWKQNHEESRPLWEKVLKHARNPYLKSMAREYLTDTIEDDRPLQLSSTTIHGTAALGAAYETNANLPYELYPLNNNSQLSSTARFSLGAQHWYPFGSVTANYNAFLNHYYHSTSLNYFENELETPISIRGNSTSDVVFRPFGGFALNEKKMYRHTYGLGVLGIAYTSEYKQYVQGSIFTDKIANTRLKVQEGNHFRFEYFWEFFPGTSVYQFLGFVEHVVGAHDNDNSTLLSFSHTDLGANFRIQEVMKGLTLGANLKPGFRIDSNSSAYFAKNGIFTYKQRKDFSLTAEASAAIPLFSYIQLSAIYGYTQTWSNFGANDYTNLNSHNHSIALFLSTQFSNY